MGIETVDRRVTFGAFPTSAYAEYARRTQGLDPLFLDPDVPLPQALVETRPMPPCLESLFGLKWRLDPWAHFIPPPDFGRQPNHFFTYDLAPSLSLDILQTAQEHLEEGHRLWHLVAQLLVLASWQQETRARLASCVKG